MVRSKASRKAFTLTEIVIVLIFSGLVAGLFLSLRKGGGESECVTATKNSLEKIKEALNQFQQTNERLPLPALRQLGVNDPKYGREASAKSLDHYKSGFVDVTFGALPFEALGLPSSYAGDCWQNKYTYVVTTDLTDKDKYRSIPPNVYYEGQIEAADTNNPGVAAKASQLAFAVISHGANSKGAVPVNYSGKESKFVKAATSELESGNFDIGDTRVIEAQMNDGKSASNLAFDDLIVFGGRQHAAINGRCRYTHTADDRGKCAQGMPDTNIVADCSVTPHKDKWQCIGLFGGTTDGECYSVRKAACPTDKK